MIIPFHAVTSFNDPSIGFGLQFGMLDDVDQDENGISPDESAGPTVAKSDNAESSSEVAGEDATADATPDQEKTAEVVSLDTFRKRPTN